MTPLVDAHIHLDFPDFDGDRPEVMARARAAGVTRFVVCASDPDRWALARALGEAPDVATFVGVHPWVAATLEPAARDELLGRLHGGVGIGEIGLDRLHGRTPEAWARQVACFRAQLALARERDVPVVLHGVRAWPELLTLVRDDGLPRAGGMAHAWSGAPDQLARAVALGLRISFGPMVLRDRARKARACVSAVPDALLLVETDGPDMFPPGETRGEPAHLVQVVAEVAALRGATADHVAAVTTANAVGWLFGGRAVESRERP